MSSESAIKEEDDLSLSDEKDKTLSSISTKLSREFFIPEKLKQKQKYKRNSVKSEVQEIVEEDEDDWIEIKNRRFRTLRGMGQISKEIQMVDELD